VDDASDHTINGEQSPKKPAPAIDNVEGGQLLEQPAPVINTTAAVTSEEAKQSITRQCLCNLQSMFSLS
jgi:hypothetical protein